MKFTVEKTVFLGFMRQKIGIMGCGWLGFPLGKSWASQGVSVLGTTTTESKCKTLQDAGIDSYHVVLTAHTVSNTVVSFLNKIDTLILNIPPGLRGKSSESFVEKIHVLLPYIEQSPIQQVLFVSSTSVYGNSQGVVSALSIPKPSTESGKQLLEVEQLLQASTAFKTTLLRLGGLIGNDRHPATMLSGKKELKNGEAPINLIHQKDCIAIVQKIVSGSFWGKTYCAVAPFHPSKKEYYTKEAIKRSLPVPEFTSEPTLQNKTIDAAHLVADLDYRFQYPTL
ncbi:MAG: NAD(P)-binding domain-containing protein [Flavobacteriaceae bacterium]|nr:NAD(P)-binding domain-containing protein [Flavobacteriaceae bacterium]MDG2313993.1 NAD(P)-binding domain-containing protein [Flavobacteriaceae bacterium]